MHFEFEILIISAITYDTTNNTIDADTNAASVAWDSIQVSVSNSKLYGIYLIIVTGII